jgi:hypothetical protein
MKKDEIIFRNSFEILDFNELESLCGGANIIDDKTEAGGAAGFHCCNEGGGQ